MLNFLLRTVSSTPRKIVRIFLFASVALTVSAVAVLLSLRYWVLPDIEKYHKDVTQLASRALGLPVSIGKIEADWHGLRPHLMFTDVRLLDEHGNTTLVLRQVDNVVSWMTLLSRELRLSTLEIVDPDLVIRRDKQGVLHVAGLQISDQPSDGKLSDWLLHQSRIIVRNGRVSWQDDLYDRPTLVLEQTQFRLENSGRHHRFAIHVAPPFAASSPLDVRGNLVGSSFLNLDDWHGELFAQVDAADAGIWGAWLKLPEELSRAKGGARAWLGMEKGRLSRLTADLDMSEVESRLATDLPLLRLNGLHGRVGWSALERGVEVSTQKLSLQMPNGFQLRPTDFHLRLAASKESRFAAGEIQANSIELAEIAVLTSYLPLSTEYRQQLADFAPRGHIADLRVQWHADEDADKRARFDVKAHFDGMSLRRVGNFPGVENLSGQVSGSDSSGVLSLNAHGTQVDFPQFLLEPLTFDTLVAQASWQRNLDGWELKLNNFSAANEDLAGTAYGTYQTDKHGMRMTDLTLNLTRASVRRVVNYLPKEELGKETVAWFQASLQGGEAEDVRLRLRGDLNDFPFPENKKGLFQVKAKGKGLVVDYTKGWPRIDDATATLLIEGARVQLDSTSIVLDGVKVQKASLTIPDFAGAETVLQIRGEASGETKGGLRFIKHSPIREYINGFTDNATARGEGKLDLQLEIPLSNKPVKLSGNYHFIDNDISLDETMPMARKITGDMAFTESLLQAKNVRAQILGGPATISVQTEANGALKVKLQGRANMDNWRKINSDPLLQSLNGAADWDADVSSKDKQFAAVVRSSLQGLGSDFPAPFSKRAQESIPLKFEFRNAATSQDVMWLQYGTQLNARMVRTDDEAGTRAIRRGYVNFGPARRMVDRDGVWITGTLPLLGLEGWHGLGLNGSGKASVFPPIDGVDLNVQKLVGYGNAVNGLSIHARNRNGTITAQLAAKDLNGELSWFPQGNGKLVARLKNAALVEAEQDKKIETVALDASKDTLASAVSIPVVDVAIDNFTYQGKPLGRFELHASQFDKDILLDHFKLTNPDGTLSANGKWAMSPAQTHVVVNAEFNNVGNVLGRFGYPNSIKNGSGLLDGDLVWAGAPNELKLTNLDGHLNLKMAKGQFLKLDPGAGKLLSVLSLQSLPKRITLDFADVFSQGFEFDSMSGVAQVRQGVLSTTDFKINGSAAAVTLSGQVDMNRETQNLHVRVLPTIGDSVSLLAFAAGPAVGAGVFIANKILRDPLDKLVSFEYNVTGSWIDPKVEKVGQAKASPQ